MAIVRGKTTQFQVSVPTTTAKEIQKLAREVGLSEAVFTSAALVMGARALKRHYSPESFIAKEGWEALARLGVDAAKDKADEEDIARAQAGAM